VHRHAPKSFAPQVLYAQSWEQNKIKNSNVRKCFNIKDITLAIMVGLWYNMVLVGGKATLMLFI